MKGYKLTSRRVMAAVSALGITREQLVEAAKASEQAKSIQLTKGDVEKAGEFLSHFGRVAAYVSSKGTIVFVGKDTLKTRWSFPKMGGEGHKPSTPKRKYVRVAPANLYNPPQAPTMVHQPVPALNGR